MIKNLFRQAGNRICRRSAFFKALVLTAGVGLLSNCTVIVNPRPSEFPDTSQATYTHYIGVNSTSGFNLPRLNFNIYEGGGNGFHFNVNKHGAAGPYWGTYGGWWQNENFRRHWDHRKYPHGGVIVLPPKWREGQVVPWNELNVIEVPQGWEYGHPLPPQYKKFHGRHMIYVPPRPPENPQIRQKGNPPPPPPGGNTPPNADEDQNKKPNWKVLYPPNSSCLENPLRNTFASLRRIILPTSRFIT